MDRKKPIHSNDRIHRNLLHSGLMNIYFSFHMVYTYQCLILINWAFFLNNSHWGHTMSDTVLNCNYKLVNSYLLYIKIIYYIIYIDNI